jgi:hypothetical protein
MHADNGSLHHILFSVFASATASLSIKPLQMAHGGTGKKNLKHEKYF